MHRQDDMNFLENQGKSKSVSRLRPNDWDRMYKHSMRWLHDKDKWLDEKRGEQRENGIAEIKTQPELINREYTDNLAIHKRQKDKQQDLAPYERLYQDADIIARYKSQLRVEYDKVLRPFKPNLEAPKVRRITKEEIQRERRERHKNMSATPTKLARQALT
jgi:hypothetical protein